MGNSGLSAGAWEEMSGEKKGPARMSSAGKGAALKTTPATPTLHLAVNLRTGHFLFSLSGLKTANRIFFQ